MTITTSKTGVWILDDAYKKTLNDYWQYEGTCDISLWAWGSNSRGVIGDDTTIDRSSPVQIPGNQWNSFNSYSSSIATKTDGTLWEWGSNFEAQMGFNDSVHRSSPSQIPGTQWCNVSRGSNHSISTKDDGTLWAWGQGNSGQLGDNTTIPKSSPIQIPGTTWGCVYAGESFNLATKTDGTLWAWGGNANGNLGINASGPSGPRSSPVQIPGTNWNKIQAGVQHSLATKSDGTLWGWGFNCKGQLGQNDLVHRSSPIQIPGTSWIDLSASGTFGQGISFGRKTDGTLWAWGSNDQAGAGGILGDGTRIQRSSPIQIPGTQWNNINSLREHAIATKIDGTLWAWGGNSSGRLGDNTTIPKSSPIQVPGSNWFELKGKGSTNFATKCSIL